MCGAIAGAFSGVEGIKDAWVEKAYKVTPIDQDDLAKRLVATAIKKHQAGAEARDRFASLAEV